MRISALLLSSSLLVIVMISLVISTNAGNAYGSITASENFCGQFPTHPECTGWRKIPITDNFWFCEYVDLPSVCNNPPNPQKEIFPLEADYCCRIYEDNDETLKDMSLLYYDVVFKDTTKKGRDLPEAYPINELVVWTDRDHYKFGDRVNVYGKFDFGDPVIKKANKSVDILFNGNKVVPNLAVEPNGWFSGYFHISDPRFYYSGISRIDVTYFHSPTLYDQDIRAIASYKFTTGEVQEPKDPFSIKISSDGEQGTHQRVSYEIDSKSALSLHQKTTIIPRLTNPEGVVFALPDISMSNLEHYINKISNFQTGVYTITMTSGDFNISETFEKKN